MRALLIILCFWLAVAAGGAAELDLKLTDGTTIRGEPTAPNDIGVVLKVDGKFTLRTPWGKFSEETLKELQKIPALKKYVDAVLTPATEDPAIAKKKGAAQKKAVTIKAVEKPARITPKPGLIAGFATPIGFLIFLSFWATSLYAGYEVARYREHPVKLVCGVSAVAPIIGPVVFLCLKPKDETQAAFNKMVAQADSSLAMPSAGGLAASTPAAEQAPEPVSKVIPETVVYKRGEFTFNRRFIESKFAGFFRLVPAETEKDLELKIHSARGEYTGRRIGKVTQTDLQLVVQKDDVFTEVTIPLNDILEIHVRHKDAP